jgi:hypothetical protein
METVSQGGRTQPNTSHPRSTHICTITDVQSVLCLSATEPTRAEAEAESGGQDSDD